MPNRLAGETSPYLLQHAENPVDWYPWGSEAFERARAEDKPVFLSVGYSACHWCHVMEQESFEDQATALLLNADFVAVKVDREERPDVDSVYMDAVHAVDGRLTADIKAARDALASSTAGELPGADTLHDAATRLSYEFDEDDGGWGGPPKFPQPMAVEHFSDPVGGFFDTSDDHEQLIIRPRVVQDGAVPSGGSMATGVPLRLAVRTREARYADAAAAASRSVGPVLSRAPLGFAKWLTVFAGFLEVRERML